MNITLYGVTPETVDEILGEVVDTARVTAAVDINVYAETQDLPLIAAAAANIPDLPEGFQLHELTPVPA